MAKQICMYFQVHQPTRLRLYRFFDIGKDSHYYDDFTNRTNIKKAAQKCYLPMNELILNAIKANNGNFKVAYQISGSALEMFDRYAPEVTESFRQLAATGCVEFVCGTYNSSLSALGAESEFEFQVQRHKDAIKEHFGVEPASFCNTELIYSDSIGAKVADMGFKTMLTEGAKHVMGWRSPNYAYTCDLNDSLKLLVRHYGLSEDIMNRIADRNWSEWPLTADKFSSWVAQSEGDVVNIFLSYETVAESLCAEEGIGSLLNSLPSAALANGIKFVTPAEAGKTLKPISELSVPSEISWKDEERDLSAWLGNELQAEAFNQLYALQEKLAILADDALWTDYGRLQESDHLYYMCTKFFSTENSMRKETNPYATPYEAFINYMNVLSDFIIRVNDAYASKQ